MTAKIAMPVHIETRLPISGPVWCIYDRNDDMVAENIENEAVAKLIIVLLNKDWQEWKQRHQLGLPNVGDTTEVEFGCVEEE